MNINNMVTFEVNGKKCVVYQLCDRCVTLAWKAALAEIQNQP